MDQVPRMPSAEAQQKSDDEPGTSSWEQLQAILRNSPQGVQQTGFQLFVQKQIEEKRFVPIRIRHDASGIIAMVDDKSTRAAMAFATGAHASEKERTGTLRGPVDPTKAEAFTATQPLVKFSSDAPDDPELLAPRPAPHKNASRKKKKYRSNSVSNEDDDEDGPVVGRKTSLLRQAKYRPEYVQFPDGSVAVNKVVLHPYQFRDWPDANNNSHIVFVKGCLWDGETWVMQLVFTDECKWARYRGNPDFEKVSGLRVAGMIKSLHTLGLRSKAWWTRSGITIPPITLAPQPCEATCFAKPRKAFRLGDVVQLARGGDVRMFYVLFTYNPNNGLNGLGPRIYHLVAVSDQRVNDPSKWMFTTGEGELAPPRIDWVRPAIERMWWVKHKKFYAENQLYFPALEPGFGKGHVVSVPSDEGVGDSRECARVIRASVDEYDRKCYTVQYPITKAHKTPKSDRDFLVDQVKGPNAFWDPTDYIWAKIHSETPETVTKRPRLGPMLAPLSFPPHLSLAQYEATLGSGGLDELILPGLDDLFCESVEPVAEDLSKTNEDEEGAACHHDAESLETPCSGMEFLKMD